VVAFIGYRGAGDREMWEDEYATYHAANLSWGDLGRLLGHMDLVHAFYYVVMRGWFAVTDDSLLMMRVPSLAAMAITAGATTLIGRRIAGTATGVLAGLLLAIVPSISRYAQEVRSYALVTMLVAVSTYFLLRAVERPTWTRWTLYAIPLALAGLLHFFAFAVLGAHLLFVLLATRPTDEARRWRFAGAAAVAFLFVIPIPGVASKQSGAVAWLAADGEAPFEFPGRLFLSDRVAYAMIPLALLGALLLWRRNRPGTVLLLAWSLAPILFVYVTSPFLHLLVARYLLFTLPAFALLAAAATVFLFGPLGDKPAGARWMLSAALVLPGLGYLALGDQKDVRTSPVLGQPGYRAALSWIKSQARPGDGIVYNDRLGGREDLARAAAEYELRRGGPKDVLLAATAAEVGTFGAVECPDPAPCLSGNKRLWLLSTGAGKQPWEGMKPAAATILEHDFSAGEVQSFPRIRVVLLTRKAPGS
jgi:mannosyltransferase